MKTLTTILTALVIQMSVFGAGPGKGAAEIYEMLEEKCPSTFTMSVNKDFEDLFDMDIDMNGKEKWVKGDFKRGKLLVVKNEEAELDDILKEFKKRDYSQIKVEDEEDEDGDPDELYMMVDQKGDHLNEVHFVIKGEENIVMLSIYGDIHIEKK